MDGFANAYQPPTLGLLTRTLIPSPLNRWVIPARIRHKTKNDVVFIRDSAIEIKEFTGDVLQDVLIKDDFGATIRAARVIGSPLQPVREIRSPGLDEIIKEENVDDGPADPMEIDQDTRPEVPPQILVLALQSGRVDKLLFLFTAQNPSDQTIFVSFQHPLPYQDNYLDRLGKNLAVDPRLVVYVLKTMSQIREEVESPEGLLDDNFVPIASERHLKLEGIILKMEFLQPHAEDGDHIILLLIIATGKDTKFYRFEWDYSKGFDSLNLILGPSLGPLGRCPLLLIPFTITTGFILICESYLAVYYNILGAGMIAHRLADENQDLVEPGSSKRLPLFTAWARPLRREDWALKNDAFFLCREDGSVRFLEFDNQSLPTFVRSQVGEIHISVDTGFAVLHPGAVGLDNANRSYDTLVVAGDMSFGGLVRFEARRDGVIHQFIPNWAPMMDCCTARVNSATEVELKNGPLAARTQLPERLFGCFGRGREHGAICEIHYGLEARSTGCCIVETGITGMWVLPDVSGAANCACVLVAEPDNTSSLLRVRSDPNGDRDVLPVEEPSVIDQESSTLAAGSTVTGLVIQVTKHSLRAFSPRTGCRLIHQFDGDAAKLGYVEGHSSAVITATVNGFLHYAEFQIKDHDLYLQSTLGTQKYFQLSSEPSSVFLLKTVKQTYAFVGTADCQIRLFTVNLRKGFSLIAAHNFLQEFAICDSIAVVCGDHEMLSQSHIAILCGLRDGSIHTFFMDTETSEPAVLRLGETLSISSTTITIKSEASSYSENNQLCSRALAYSADTFCYLSFHPSIRGALNVDVQNIVLTGLAEVSFRQISLSSIAQSDPWNYDRYGAFGHLYLVDRSELHLAELQDSLRSHPIVRRVPVPGTPNRIMFSNQVNKLIVAYTTLRTTEPRRTSGPASMPKKRLLYPSLSFFDPDHSPSNAFDEATSDDVHSTSNIPNYVPHGALKVIGPSGMKILGMTEWIPSLEGKAFPLLAIYGIRARKTERSDTGIICLYKIASSISNGVTLEHKLDIGCRESVYSLAIYGASSLVFCSGKTLHLRTMTITDGKLRWDGESTHELRSPGNHVSVREPFIYVTTGKDSVSVLKYGGNGLLPQCSDEAQHSGAHHLLLPEHSLILSSDIDNRIRGLWQAPNTPISNSFRTVFEAVLPGVVRKLFRATTKPPWLTDPRLVDDAIIGSGIDGAFYQLYLLDENKWRLLRFLQHLAERNATVCPYTYSERPKRHIEPSRSKAFYMHVDGDILSRILERGTPDPSELVRVMLQQEPSPDHDFDTPNDRERRFFEIVDAALGDLSGQSRMEAVIDYLRVALQPVL
ncbi:hypothetical protein MMC13_007846 [Lambiella insularis]|nr:hypothetical protein [Lambiella insularis]